MQRAWCSPSRNPPTPPREQKAVFVNHHQNSHTSTGSLAPQPSANREGEQKCSLPGKGMHVDRMGHSSSNTFWLNFLKRLSQGEDLWVSSGFLESKACKFPGTESHSGINCCKKGSGFFDSPPCTWPAKTTPSYLPAYDPNFLSAASWVIPKSPNTTYPSPRASTTTRILATKRSDSQPAHTRSWPRQLLIRMWRYQPHPENGRGHKVEQTEWHWQTCESEHKGEMKDVVDSIRSLEVTGSLIARHVQNGESR